MSDVSILIPAAGTSSRMRGTDKLLERLGGVPMLAWQVRAAQACGVPVLVTVPAGDAGRARRAAIADLHPVIVEVADASEGIAASIRAGVERLGDADGVMILLADLPEIETTDLQTMIAAFQSAPGICRAIAEDGTAGHPVIFPREMFSDLLALSGDEGARRLLQDNIDRVQPVPLPGSRAITDLDTPEAWAEWRAKTGL